MREYERRADAGREKKATTHARSGIEREASREKESAWLETVAHFSVDTVHYMGTRRPRRVLALKRNGEGAASPARGMRRSCMTATRRFHELYFRRKMFPWRRGVSGGRCFPGDAAPSPRGL